MQSVLPVVASLNSADQYNASYLELFRQTGHHLHGYYDHLANRPAGDSLIGPSWSLLMRHSPHFFTRDLAAALLGAVLLTFFRLFLNRVVITILVRLEVVEKKSSIRFAESLYNFLLYSSSFSLSCVIERDNEYLSHPERLWIGFSLSNQIPALVWAVYQLEMAHYLHSMYAVMFINKWSKDSAVLFFHHIVALLLLSISFLTKTYRIGVLVLYLHDICDIIMEGCKVLIKLQLKSPWSKVADIIRIVGFAAFILFWFVFRLYLFPLRVIYPSVMYFTNTPIHAWVPLTFTLYALLWFIFAMNVYWATLIGKVMVNALLGGHEEIEDIREYEDIEPLEVNGEVAKKLD